MIADHSRSFPANIPIGMEEYRTINTVVLAGEGSGYLSLKKEIEEEEAE